MTDPNALHGDGINFPFFNLLWSKNSNDDEKPPRSADKRKQPDGVRQSPILRVPDTVVFLFGQPHQWYFTSKNGGPDKNKTMILRKRRANLTLANIEDVFLSKHKQMGDDDVVAYFISSKSDGGDMSDEKNEQPASLDACSAAVDNDVSCDMEYFNKKTLHEFLQHGRNNKSGILQRFIAPHGGGRHNSQIRAIWTPKLCILERRRTKQDLHDTRFALYERAITFDGPDVHSISVPLRGTVLSGRVESICNEIVKHIADASNGAPSASKKGTSNAFHGVARMVLNFKVDGNGKIWILWSNSLRLQSGPSDRTNLTESDTLSSMQATSPEPLNMETVVTLPSSVKLTQAPNHNTNVKVDNKQSFATCPSCNKHDTNPHFQPVPYKTIIQHFEKTLEMLKERDDSNPTKVWPPEDRFIKAAGCVGFGSLPSQLARDREVNPKRKYSEETHLIPPVIRHMHHKLRSKGYAMYRSDPLFLLKTCSVCEDCFLAYADLTSTSFIHMTRPIEPYETDKHVHYDFPSNGMDSKRCGGGKKIAVDASSAILQTSVFGKDFGNIPALPPAIMEPPLTANSESSTPLKPKDTLFNTLPTYFPSCDSQKKLGHMIDSQKMLAEAKGSPRIETSKNPYEEDLEKMINGQPK
ncbi:hypothetical protein ACHAXR_012097 [Thalassiosira sp. AJA248-18]